jgi:hypothetical protein
MCVPPWPDQAGRCDKGRHSQRKSPPGERLTGFPLSRQPAAYFLGESGEVADGLVLSEGLLESIGLLESTGLLESEGGAATLPEEPTSPDLVSVLSVVVDEVPSAFLCLVFVIELEDESPCMPEAGLVASGALES